MIFDRIREDLKLGVRGSFKEIINQALNQTLSRTADHLGARCFWPQRRFTFLAVASSTTFAVHLPHRHSHRHVFEHLHRQRAGVVAAQRASVRPSVGSGVNDAKLGRRRASDGTQIHVPALLKSRHGTGRVSSFAC